MDGRGGRIVTAVTALLVLLACAYHVGRRGAGADVLIQRDRFGIPKDGSDNRANERQEELAEKRVKAVAPAQAGGGSSKLVKSMERREGSMMKTLQELSTEVGALSLKVSELSSKKAAHPTPHKASPSKGAPAVTHPAPAAPKQQAAVVKKAAPAAAAPHPAAASVPTGGVAVARKKAAAGRLLEKASREARGAGGFASGLVADGLSHPGVVYGSSQRQALLRLRGEIDHALSSEGAPKAAVSGVGAGKRQSAEHRAVPPRHTAAAAAAAVRQGAMATEGGARGALEQATEEVSALQQRETSLLDGLPAAENRVKRDRVAVANIKNSLAIAKDRLALAERAAEDSETLGSGSGRPGLQRAWGAAQEVEERVEQGLKRAESRLEEDEGDVARAPEMARVLARRRKELQHIKTREEVERRLREASALMAHGNFAA